MLYINQFKRTHLDLHQELYKEGCQIEISKKKNIKEATNRKIDDIVFKKDKNGNIILNKQLFPKINWIAILLQLGRLIALYVHQRLFLYVDETTE